MRDFLLGLDRKKMAINAVAYLVILALFQMSQEMGGLLGDAIRAYLVVFPALFMAWLAAVFLSARERR